MWVLCQERMDRHRGLFITSIKFLLMTLDNSRDENDLGKPLGVLAYNRYWKVVKQS